MNLSRIITMVIAGLVLTGCLAAKSQQVRAPLPPEVETAKTIAIVNHTGSQSYTDEAFDELQNWGRFLVVTDPSKADIILVINSSESQYPNDATVSFFLSWSAGGVFFSKRT